MGGHPGSSGGSPPGLVRCLGSPHPARRHGAAWPLQLRGAALVDRLADRRWPDRCISRSFPGARTAVARRAFDVGYTEHALIRNAEGKHRMKTIEWRDFELVEIRVGTIVG